MRNGVNMLEYNNKQICLIDKNGIKLSDGTTIIFDECRRNWASSRGIRYEETFCVAERNISGRIPYFMFYTNIEIKIVFKKSIFPWNKKYKRDFMNLQMALNRMGYSSYDCS